MQASQFRRMLLRFKLENSFLTKAHLAILKAIFEANSSKEEELSPKILSFLSLQMDYKVAKWTILQRIRSHLAKGLPNQDSAAFTIEPEQHQERSHLTIKANHMAAATSQWRNKRSTVSSSYEHVTQLFKMLLEVNLLHLEESAVDTFAATVSK